MQRISMLLIAASSVLAVVSPEARGQGVPQPKVAPGPNEPDWVVLLDKLYGLKMVEDLKNPIGTPIETTTGTFRKAGPGPVRFTPILALGLETVNQGGWYRTGPTPPTDKVLLWSYRHKHTTADFAGSPKGAWKSPPPPPLSPGSTTLFDPGEATFGFWVANEGLKQSDVYTEPKLVAARNPRLAKQPYKVMIYPAKDRTTGQLVPNSYLIGWEYSTNDDFQDIVTQVDNVILSTTP